MYILLYLMSISDDPTPPLLAWHIFLIVASPTPPNVAQVSIHGPSASMSSPRSPSHNNNDFPIPSLYLLSTVNVALAVDYSKDVRLADGVVDTPPPAKVVGHAYIPFPSQ